MSESKSKAKNRQAKRIYRSETQRLLSLHLIPTRDHKDEHADQQGAGKNEKPSRSPELIQRLIDYIKDL